LITEEEIKEGMFGIFQKQRLVVGGGAAVGVGALIHRKLEVKGKRVVSLVTGSSIASNVYLDIIQSRLNHAPRPSPL
jgi:threonine dehydratase